MKRGLSTVILLSFIMAFGAVQAQLLIGPVLKGGMTYGKNFVVEDTSSFYIKNSPSAFAAAGLDILYQFDDNIRLQLGGQFSYKSYNLQAPDGREGLSFSNISRTALAVSVPLALHYRIPMGESGNKYFNIIAGHSFDILFQDSSVVRSSETMVDSGMGYTVHAFQVGRKDSSSLGFIPTVMLGAGVDIQSESGNVLNVSLLWGLSLGRVLEANIREYETLNGPYDPAGENEFPEEFPEHYFDAAMRGSTVSLRLSYYFNLGDVFSGSDEDKPAKEKKEKKEKQPRL